MNITEFNQEVEDKQEKLNAIEKQIATVQTELEGKEGAYKDALRKNERKQADKLFPVIEGLQTDVRRGKKEHSMMEVVYQEQEDEMAVQTIQNLDTIYNEYKQKSDKLEHSMIPLIDKLSTIIEQSDELKKELNNERRPYERLATAKGLNPRKLTKNHVRSLETPVADRIGSIVRGGVLV